MQVADLNALAELGKVYQDSLALSAQLRNLSSFRLQQDKVLGRGSLAVVQEGKRTGGRDLPGQANDSGRVIRWAMSTQFGLQLAILLSLLIECLLWWLSQCLRQMPWMAGSSACSFLHCLPYSMLSAACSASY